MPFISANVSGLTRDETVARYNAIADEWHYARLPADYDETRAKIALNRVEAAWDRGLG